MDLLEEYKRRKETRSSKPKSGMSWKEWLTLSISICAFAISTGTSYYTLVRKEDDFSVLINQVGKIDTNDQQFDISLRSDLTFLNAGNRPVSLTELVLVVRQLKEDGELQDDCHSGDVKLLNFDAEPFVLKPGEMISKKFLLAKKEGDRPTLSYRGTTIVKFSKANAVSKEPMMGLCLWFSFLTADGKAHGKRIPVMLDTFQPSEPIYVGRVSDLLYDPAASQSLYKRIGFPWN